MTTPPSKTPAATTSQNQSTPDKVSKAAKSKAAPEFYTTQELAEKLRVAKITIYRMADRGELPPYNIGRVRRFRREDVEAFLERCKGVTAVE
jgi:excisionase family DNA binding protein